MTPNRKQTDELLEKLGEDCRIGDVLERTQDKKGDQDPYGFGERSIEICCLWHLAGGCNKSLQDIIEASGWERSCIRCGAYEKERMPGGACYVYGDKVAERHLYETELRDPNARNLLEFIFNLNL